MKRFHLMLAAALILAGCTNSSKTKVVGDISAYDAPDTVYVYQMGDETPMKVPVKEGKFSFEVPTDKTSGCFVGAPDDPSMLGIFVPEGGTVRVSRNPDGELIVKGSGKQSLTDALQDFYMTYDGIARRFSAIADSLYEKGAVTKENEEETFADLDAKYLDEVAALCEKTASSNKDNFVGLTAVESLANAAGVERVRSLVGVLDPALWEKDGYKDLKNMVDAIGATEEGKMFVDFSVAQSDGSEASLSDYVGKGKYVVLDFWASWCAPCAAELPTLKQIASRYPGDKVALVGVAVWDDEAESRRFLSEENITWPQILGVQGEASIFYGVQTIPHMILFGPDGIILRRSAHASDIMEALDKALK